MDSSRRSRLNVLLFVLFVGVCVFAWSNSMRYGNAAQRAGNYALARMWYLLAAHTGDANAQNNLAGFYAEGLGGARDDAQAAKWFAKAAAAGVSAAKFNLSNFYEEGRGVPKDIGRTVQLLQELAEQHDSVAAFNLGNIYATGRSDFPQDLRQAVHWYEKSAKAGYASAQYNLGSVYFRGHGDVPQDFALAAQWIRMAAQNNHHKAQLDYGLMRMTGIGTQQDTTDGLQWLQRAAQDPATLGLLKQKIALLCGPNPALASSENCARISTAGAALGQPTGSNTPAR